MNTTNTPKKLVTVASFNQESAGERLKSALRLEGVQAELQDESRLQKYWFLVSPKAGIHVQVPAESFEHTRKLLERPEMARLLKEATLCPSCGSSRVQYPAVTRKNILPAVVRQILVLIRAADHNYYCEDCHFTWPRAGHHKKLQPVERGTPLLS